MKPKCFKCKYCGKKVFKSIWEGIELIREVRLESYGVSTESHYCHLNFGEKISRREKK